MATFTGTSGADTIVGTDEADLIKAMGGIDLLSGGNGGDEYQMYQSGGLHVVTIDEAASDSASDSITNARSFYASASLGYSAWGGAERSGDDLVIDLPGKPSRFRKPGYGPLEITIRDHYTDGTVETLEAGDFTFQLLTSSLFSGPQNVLMAGNDRNDHFDSGNGNDIIFGNTGHDTILSHAGNDTIMGGRGRDVITSGSGDDHIFGGGARDIIKAGTGHDRVQLGAGNDLARGQAGNDWLDGESGHDKLFGGAGQDMLIGGTGNDTLLGGRGGDTYQFWASDLTEPGHDLIRDIGDRKPAYNDIDIIDIVGLYGASSGSTADAYAAIAVERIGDDMRIVFGDDASSILVVDQFQFNSRKSVEQLMFDGGYWSAIEFNIIDVENDNIGDDRRDRLNMGGEYHEVIFGNDDANDVFGDSGTNLIWLGGGADTLIYKESDPQTLYDLDNHNIGGGAVNDIVMDFDVTQDRLDFTEIAGLGFDDLVLSQAADGDTHIYWASNDHEISSIFIELRDVALEDVTSDLFLFA